MSTSGDSERQEPGRLTRSRAHHRQVPGLAAESIEVAPVTVHPTPAADREVGPAARPTDLDARIQALEAELQKETKIRELERRLRELRLERNDPPATHAPRQLDGVQMETSASSGSANHGSGLPFRDEMEEIKEFTGVDDVLSVATWIQRVDELTQEFGWTPAKTRLAA